MVCPSSADPTWVETQHSAGPGSAKLSPLRGSSNRAGLFWSQVPRRPCRLRPSPLCSFPASPPTRFVYCLSFSLSCPTPQHPTSSHACHALRAEGRPSGNISTRCCVGPAKSPFLSSFGESSSSSPAEAPGLDDRPISPVRALEIARVFPIFFFFASVADKPSLPTLHTGFRDGNMGGCCPLPKAVELLNPFPHVHMSFPFCRLSPLPLFFSEVPSPTLIRPPPKGLHSFRPSLVLLPYCSPPLELVLAELPSFRLAVDPSVRYALSLIPSDPHLPCCSHLDPHP
jgi:hypothetical protein